MPEPLTETLPADAPKRRRRATRRDMEVRDLRIFQKFAAGCSVEEIALRERVTQRRVRERLLADFRAAGDGAAGGHGAAADSPLERGFVRLVGRDGRRQSQRRRSRR